MVDGVTPPTAVLFDADGVLQYAPPAWRDLVARARPGFFDRLLVRERPFLDGRERDWLPALDGFLADEGGAISRDDFLDAWMAFRPDPAALAVVGEVRAAGVRTVLATNQQAHRAAMMHDLRFYDDVMDDQFFSYLMGALKPDAAYFRAILDATGLPAGDVLFIDDVEANVEGARALGIRARHKPEHDGPDALRAILVEEGVLPAVPDVPAVPETAPTLEETR